MNSKDTKLHKKPHIILSSFLIWCLLVFGVIWPWIHQINQYNLELSIFAHISALIWWLVLLWALHHFSFQLVSLFKKDSIRISNPNKPGVTILYLTCDDFSEKCCQSCLDQSHSYTNIKLIICDDSKTDPYKNKIDAFHDQNKNCLKIRRPDKGGFKAGNLNYVIEKHVEDEWILIVDADQLLPEKYVSQLVKNLPENNSDIAFVQASQEPLIDHKSSSAFQIALSPEIQLYYSRDLAQREKFGFVPMLGHGVIFKKSVWKAVGKFPEIVSEDFAFSLQLANKGYKGIYCKEVISSESFPYDFGGFIIRLKKFSGGTAELLRKEFVSFLFGQSQIVEKSDLIMLLLWYVLMPFVTINGFLGAYVCYELWDEKISYIHPILPYLYTWILLSVFSLSISVTESIKKALKFYFWSTAIYTAAMPLASLSFIKHLFLPVKFTRTPKNNETSDPSILDSLFMYFIGIFAIIFGSVWFSPFSPILIGQGVAYASYHLYGKLCSESAIGKLSRSLIYLPGIFMIIALFLMWKWGR